MKNLLITLFITVSALAQNDTLQNNTLQNNMLQMDTLKPGKLKTRIFSFTPTPDAVDRVNGLALGVGYANATVNGLNVEINPLSVIIVMFQDPVRTLARDNGEIHTKVNGLHISTSGFMDHSQLNGFGISVFSVTTKTNGVSLTGFYNVSKELNGLHVAALNNTATQKGNGLFIALSNRAGRQNGVQLGAFNSTDYARGFTAGLSNTCTQEMTGLQIGFFNRTKKCRGLQIGLWNINEKRSLPFINW